MSDANGREPFAKSRESGPEVREPFAKSRELDANLREEWLPASEAAPRLGVSIRTVQKRAAKGELPSRTEEGRRLFVCLPLREPFAKDATPGETFANVRESAPEVREPDAKSREADATPSADALIEQLQSENAFLRERIENHEQEIQRRDVAEAENRRLWLSDRQELSELKQRLAITARASEPMATAPGVDAGEEADGAKQDAGNAAQQVRRRWWQVWKA